MRRRRPAARKTEDLASGPGKLTLAMGITRKLNGADLVEGPLQVRRPLDESPFEIHVTPRIGITTPLRRLAPAFRHCGKSLRQPRLSCAGGDVVSLGCNDVPAPGGGLYTTDHGADDQRDHKLKGDSNDVRKAEIIDDIIVAFTKRFLPGRNPDEILIEARPLLRETMVGDVTEFGRAVHAEMDALITAGRNGISFREATLYTTTFPCHNCTRHIVTAGVRRVVYIEPYPKSLARELHSDAIRINGAAKKDDRRVPFEPFLGIGPRRFFDLFSLKLSSGYVVERKRNGAKAPWEQRRDSKPRVPMAPTSYLEREQLIHKTLNQIFSIRQDEYARADQITGTESQERSGILETGGDDGSPSRKLARMEDRRTGDSLATGDERK